MHERQTKLCFILFILDILDRLFELHAHDCYLGQVNLPFGEFLLCLMANAFIYTCNESIKKCLKVYIFFYKKWVFFSVTWYSESVFCEAIG